MKEMRLDMWFHLLFVKVNDKWLIRKDIPQQNGRQSHD